jgi:hypothetical protein
LDKVQQGEDSRESLGILGEEQQASRIKEGGGGGAGIVTAQATPMKCDQITEEQQLRRHGVIQSMRKEQQRLNVLTTLDIPIQAHLVCNVDETSIMVCQGTLKFHGDAGYKKHRAI